MAPKYCAGLCQQNGIGFAARIATWINPEVAAGLPTRMAFRHASQQAYYQPVNAPANICSHRFRTDRCQTEISQHAVCRSVKIGKRVDKSPVQIECNSGNVDRELYASGLNAGINHRDKEARGNAKTESWRH